MEWVIFLVSMRVGLHCCHRLCHFTLHAMHISLYYRQTRLDTMNITHSIHIFLWQ